MNREEIPKAGRLACAALLLSLPLGASSLQYSASTRTEGIPVGNVDAFHEILDAHNGTTLPVVLNPNLLIGSVTFTGLASFGLLATSSYVTGLPGPGAPAGTYYSAGGGVGFFDTITIHGATSGFLSLDFYFHGILDPPGTMAFPVPALACKSSVQVAARYWVRVGSAPFGQAPLRVSAPRRLQA